MTTVIFVAEGDDLEHIVPSVKNLSVALANEYHVVKLC